MVRRFATLFVLVAAFSATNSHAQSPSTSNTVPPTSPERSRLIFEIKLGRTASGDFSSEGESFGDYGIAHYRLDSKSGLNGGVSLEFPSSTGMCLAAVVDFHQISPEDSDEKKNFLEFGLQLKSTVRDSLQKVAFRLFGGAAYGAMPQMVHLRAASCLVLKGGLELAVFPSPRGIGVVCDAGVMGSVFGRSEGESFSMSPRPFVRVGVAFR